MHSALRYILLLLLLSQTFQAQAKYVVKGKVNMKGDWQHQIYLATIDKLDDYYSANAENIINVAAIDEAGNFVLEGDNLPEYAQFYRLYLIKEEQSEFDVCLFVGGDEHNFVHLLLENESQLTIQADTSSFAPFGDYMLKGNEESQLMRKLSRLVYPSYIFYEIKFPSELKFSQDKLNRDLFQFADTCSSTMVSLAALNNSDFDTYFTEKLEQYTSFGEELKSALPEHPYTKDYFRKMRYYGEDIESTTSPWFKVATFGLALLAIFLFWQNQQLRRQIGTQPNVDQSLEKLSFTPQEIKILQMIVAGKANKEIAGELYIELSTVKSHINKLYAKLKVKNRQEAKNKVKNLDLEGL